MKSLWSALGNIFRRSPTNDVFGINFRLPAEVKQVDGWYVAHCQALDVSSQGRTHQQALDALTEAVGAVIEYCIEHQTIDQVLQELGFTHVVNNANAAASQKPRESIQVPIELVANAAHHARPLAHPC